MDHNPKRLKSLDFFRGTTVAAMILVNNPGSWSYVYPPLAHAKWDGCTPTDLIFPFFLFIAGVAIPLAMRKRKQAGTPLGRLCRKIATRSAAIFLIGLFLNAFPKFELATLRVPGVLQRIAIVYLACALAYLFLSLRTQTILAAGILVAYGLALRLMPFPGGEIGSLEPGNNLAAWVDSRLLAGHMWSATETWDPEGVLSTFPAVVTGFTGVCAGCWLLTARGAYEKVSGLFAAGAVLIVGGLAWAPFLPLNKALWTSSYVLYTSGIALQALALCYLLIDVLGWHRGITPAVAYGANALSVFVASGILGRLLVTVGWETGGGARLTLKEWIFSSCFRSWLGPYPASLAFALTMVLLFLPLVWYLYAKRIILRV